ncbi:MAG: ABC transporter ATP-binding protein [Candidatus Eremiobacteraeota bacterium]|nr:ABC transporter ATP-binding protein [Candidatus Eremiobacteraeota bacterium]MCW5867795.1 ABC transporter ATP-binding protein [Candidatus Eremiobacteraeota bacterium]
MLSIRNLSIDYQLPGAALSVLQNVSLDFPGGQVTALIGESGSGKTTLTGAILGLLASNARVRAGRLLWKDENLLEQTPERLRQFRWRQASVVFQAAQGAWNPSLTIGQQMLDTCADHGFPAHQPRREMLLQQVRLTPERVIAAYPHQLSGGMRQRALIAMSLMLEPELLILDEPTTALDLITQSYIFDILAEIHQSGLTMILVTHDLAAVARLADRVAVLYAGTVVEVGPAGEIFENPRHPYTQVLIRSAPDVHGGEVARGAEGLPPDLRQRPPGCIFASRCSQVIERCRAEVPPLKEGVACWHW